MRVCLWTRSSRSCKLGESGDESLDPIVRSSRPRLTQLVELRTAGSPISSTRRPIPTAARPARPLPPSSHTPAPRQFSTA